MTPVSHWKVCLCCSYHLSHCIIFWGCVQQSTQTGWLKQQQKCVLSVPETGCLESTCYKSWLIDLPLRSLPLSSRGVRHFPLCVCAQISPLLQGFLGAGPLLIKNEPTLISSHLQTIDFQTFTSVRWTWILAKKGTFFNPQESPNSNNSQKDSGENMKERATLYTKKWNQKG